MSKTLSRHKWIETDDGSLTLYSEEFGEACHSSSGAKSETLLHYVEGCQVRQRIKGHAPFTILEVGFGPGMGFLTTEEALRGTGGLWHFISLEIDRNLVEWFGEKHPTLKRKTESTYEMRGENFTLTILVGDARVALPDYLLENPQKFHAIYQDAFSPRRNPTLWAIEWFELLKLHSSEDVILSTYSSSSSIRKSLIKAGWALRKGEKFGPKRSSTRGHLKGVTDEEILFHLERSPAIALSDDNVEEFLKK